MFTSLTIVRSLTVVVIAASLVGLAPAAMAQCTANEHTPLAASDGTPNANYGASVSMSGLVAIVGASSDGSGSAYMYRFDGTIWHFEQKLVASDAQPADLFGIAVAVSGDVAVVGARLEEDDPNVDNASGAAYVFRYDGAAWVEEAKLKASDAAGGDLFGGAVAIWGDVIAVGAIGQDNGGPPDADQGAVYVFRYDGASWYEEQKLVASDAADDDSFGVSLDVHQDWIVVGADGDDDYGALSGSAYVFAYDGGTGTWAEQQKLTASDATTGARFGKSVALHENTVVVGSPRKGAGSAYVFGFDGAAWVQEQKLTASDASSGSKVGEDVDVNAGYVLLGAPSATPAGAAYVFGWNGASWTQASKLEPSDGGTDDSFGSSVALGESHAIVGAWFADAAGVPQAGKSYVFSGISDCNDNGILDACDLATGVSLDCNGNGVPDECDIASGLSQDCNNNGVPDECDIASGTSLDLNGNGIPDECESLDPNTPDGNGGNGGDGDNGDGDNGDGNGDDGDGDDGDGNGDGNGDPNEPSDGDGDPNEPADGDGIVPPLCGIFPCGGNAVGYVPLTLLGLCALKFAPRGRRRLR